MVITLLSNHGFERTRVFHRETGNARGVACLSPVPAPGRLSDQVDAPNQERPTAVGCGRPRSGRLRKAARSSLSRRRLRELPPMQAAVRDPLASDDGVSGRDTGEYAGLSGLGIEN